MRYQPVESEPTMLRTEVTAWNDLHFSKDARKIKLLPNEAYIETTNHKFKAPDGEHKVYRLYRKINNRKYGEWFTTKHHNNNNVEFIKVKGV